MRRLPRAEDNISDFLFLQVLNRSTHFSKRLISGGRVSRLLSDRSRVTRVINWRMLLGKFWMPFDRKLNTFKSDSDCKDSPGRTISST